MSAQTKGYSARDDLLSSSSIGHVRDASGNLIFSAGDAGSAHVMAHRLFDQRRPELGRRWLGQWLARRTGWGSDWIHLHLHMALFELDTGNWVSSYVRFRDQILPAARTTELALTDAPALLWKLALRAEAPVKLPWEALRRTALQRMLRPADSFVTLHNLLALAGARDAEGIRRWIDASPCRATPSEEALLGEMARALVESIGGDFGRAADRMRAALPSLPQLGGSQAQNELFTELVSSWRHLAFERRSARNHALAA